DSKNDLRAGQVPSHCDLVAHGFSLAVLRAWRLPARARKATILGARTTGDWTWLPTFFSTVRAWIGGASRDWWTAPCRGPTTANCTSNTARVSRSPSTTDG